MFYVPSNRSLNQGPNKFCWILSLKSACIQQSYVLQGLSLLRPLTLKSHPDPYYLCQERRLFGPLGVEPQVEFEGPMCFFLYKSHWICGKGCFSGHHQSSYLWFGFIDTRLGQKSLKKPAMNPPSPFVSFCVWMARNLSKSSLPASLRGQQIGSQRRSWLEQVL